MTPQSSSFVLNEKSMFWTRSRLRAKEVNSVLLTAFCATLADWSASNDFLYRFICVFVTPLPMFLPPTRCGAEES